MPGPDVAGVFRAEYGRAVAVLTRVLGNLDLAEDAVQEAFVIAASRWPAEGRPPSPAGWIITTARNRAIDRLRRESVRVDRQREATLLHAAAGPVPDEVAGQEGAVQDDRLRLLFTCCHPALAPDARVALTLRLLGGLTTAEIARAFMVPETTMGQRISRAKAKIRDARIPYRVPRGVDLPERTGAVLSVVYLIFNAGYQAGSGPGLVRDELCDEAVRLGRVLVELMPDEPEAAGLLALMLLASARRAARTGPSGSLVPLADQDRSLWDASMIGEGHELVRRCLRRNAPGVYQLQAAIGAVHTSAARACDTDWGQVVALYDQLAVLDPGPVVALNRAVAVAELDGPVVGLALVERLDEGELRGYHVFHAVRADLLRRAGRAGEAGPAYDRAVELAGSEPERRFLAARRAELE